MKNMKQQKFRYSSSIGIVLLLLFAEYSGSGYAQTSSLEFASAQEAIVWAEVNKNAATEITHITITGDNEASDLLKLNSLNNHSGNGLFKSLESLELSAQTGSLPHGCFYAHYAGAQWLKYFAAPNLIGVGNWAFRLCSNLSMVELPAVEEIGDFAFYNCRLASIHLPVSLKRIGANPFLGCKHLTALSVETENEYFTAEDQALYNADKTLLIAYPLGRATDVLALPATTTIIGSNAFGTGSTVVNVECTSVVCVRDWAFEQATGLKVVKFADKETIRFERGVFSGVRTNGISLYLDPEGEEYKNNVSGNLWKEYEWKEIVMESSTGTPVINESLMSIYPNPVRERLYIESPEIVIRVTVSDLNAKTVLQAERVENGIDLSTLPDGVYLLHIYTKTGMKSERVLKIN